MAVSDVNVGTTLKPQSVPVGPLQSKIVSGSSAAQLCFMHQRFSYKLQLYLMSYVLAMNSYKAINVY